MTATTDPPARIPEVSSEQMTGEMREFFDRWMTSGFDRSAANPVLLTFAHNLATAGPFSQFTRHLLTTTSLPVKIRQMTILRTAWLCKSTYMWSSHLDVSLRSGLSPALFSAIQRGPDDPHFTAFERTVVSSTDQLGYGAP